MIGQPKLTEKLNTFTLDNLPRTLLLEGAKGCGKHYFSKLISDRLGLRLVDITKSISLELIEEIMVSSNPSIYLIDTVQLTERVENIILKFLEEPLKNTYIFLFVEDRNQLIETIRNRCHIISFQRYKKDDLISFIPENYTDIETLLDIAETPGQILWLSQYNLTEMIEFSNKILEKTSIANYSNLLTISDKIAFKNEKDKFDFEVFIVLLNYCSYKNVIANLPYSLEIYKLVNSFINKTKVKNVNKQYLLENFLIELKLKLKGLMK